MNFYRQKLAFVMGGSEGIGYAVVQSLLEQGANVVFTARRMNKLELAFSSLQKYKIESAQNLAYKAFDVSDATACQTSLDAMVSEFGVPDFVINCAGLARPAYLIDQKQSDFLDMLNTNLVGVVNVCRALVPHLQRAKKGVIVNTSSIAGFIGLFGYSGYCATKFAVVGFSEALRRELKPYGIVVSVLCPPNTQTPGLEQENLTKPLEVLKTEEKIKPVAAEVVANYLIQKLPKKKFFLIPTFDGRLSHFISRHMPFVLNVFVKRPSL